MKECLYHLIISSRRNASTFLEKTPLLLMSTFWIQGPTQLKNMLVKLDHFTRWGEICRHKKCLKPPTKKWISQWILRVCWILRTQHWIFHARVESLSLHLLARQSKKCGYPLVNRATENEPFEDVLLNMAFLSSKNGWVHSLKLTAHPWKLLGKWLSFWDTDTFQSFCC